MSYHFHVPSGIGDVSWLYSKLKNLGPAYWHVADGWPHRTAPFLKLLPNVINADYEPFNYQDIIVQEEHHEFGITPKWADFESKQFARYYIECNRHLEAGRRLEDWLPDLPTSFHYDINLEDSDIVKAVNLLRGLPRPLWGISAASYRGSEAWKTWGFEQWQGYLKALEREAGGTIILMGGFWDDLTHTLAVEGEYKDIVGRTSVGSMIEVLRILDGYIGFSSGMGILRTVMNKPVFMMWPDHQVELSTSWAPQDMLEKGEYVASLWREPKEVFARTKVWLRTNFNV